MTRPPDFPSDEEFFELIRREPDRALEVVVRHLAGPLLGYLTKVLGSQQDAEDCLQEALVRVARDLELYDKAGSAVGWVFLRAKWTAQKFRQRAARARETEPAITPQRDSSRMDDESKKQRQELATEFLTGLPDSKRELFEMRFVLGWTHEEIAAELGAHADAVRKASSRLVAEFRRVLERHGLWP